MTFYLPAGLSTEAARELERACIAGGPDNMPWPSKVQIESGHLTVARDVDESGYLVVPWETRRAGRLMGTTATLMERSHPYQLQVELARGKVNQVRCQAADWQAGGLNVPRKLEEEIRTVSLTLGHALIEPATRSGRRIRPRPCWARAIRPPKSWPASIWDRCSRFATSASRGCRRYWAVGLRSPGSKDRQYRRRELQ